MTTRTTKLQSGPYPTITNDTFGTRDEHCQLELGGDTVNGSRFRILLRVDDYALAHLATRIRDHFEQKARREAEHAKYRMRAFKETTT